MKVDEITTIANKILGNNDSQKIDLKDLRRIFDNNSFSDQVKYSHVNEYLKSIILSQFHIYDVLAAAHNPSDEKEASIIDRQEKIIYEKLDSEGKQRLNFDSDIIHSLFGDNDLGISSKEEASYCYNHVRRNSFDICYEENFKKDYQETKNPIKKIIGYRQYKKLQKKQVLEDKFTKNTREFIAAELKKDNIKVNALPSIVSLRFDNSFKKYDESRIVLALAHMSIQSLQKSNQKINIMEEAYAARNVMQPYISDMMEEGFRKEDVCLGDFEPINHKEVQNAMDKLQDKYEYLSTDSNISDKDYICGCSEILADFIYTQPFNNGNKRTALYVFNSMLLSKGLIPPILSVARDNDFTKVLYKCQNKDYDDLKDLLVSKVAKMNPDRNIIPVSPEEQKNTEIENISTIQSDISK